LDREDNKRVGVIRGGGVTGVGESIRIINTRSQKNEKLVMEGRMLGRRGQGSHA